MRLTFCARWILVWVVIADWTLDNCCDDVDGVEFEFDTVKWKREEKRKWEKQTYCNLDPFHWLQKHSIFYVAHLWPRLSDDDDK